MLDIITMDPPSPRFIISLATAYNTNGKSDWAQQNLQNALSKDSEQTVHPRSLVSIRCVLYVDSEEPDQIARMS